MGAVRIVRMTPVGLEHALEGHVVIRPSADLVAAELLIGVVPFMSLIGSTVWRKGISPNWSVPIHCLIAMF
jgi:hypothetical protein